MIAAAGALMCAPAAGVLAQGAKPTTASLTARIIEGGTWDFWSHDRGSDLKPVCTEVWTFRADGTATVLSGRQIIEQTWRAEVDGDGLQWIYTTNIASNAEPDCIGKVADPTDFPRPESGLVLKIFNGGVIFTCQRPERYRSPEGKVVPMWTEKTCWGSIAPRKRER